MFGSGFLHYKLRFIVSFVNLSVIESEMVVKISDVGVCQNLGAVSSCFDWVDWIEIRFIESSAKII